MLSLMSSASIFHEHTTVAVNDGTEIDLYVARPADEHNRHAGVIVLQEIWGVNGHIREVTDRIARLGYTAVAPDLFHRTAPGFNAPYEDFSGIDHANKLTGEGIAADLTAAYSFVEKQLLESDDRAKIATLGFCMGGRLSWVANAMLDLTCAVSFYGGGIAENHLEMANAQKSPLLLFWAGKDQHISGEHTASIGSALRTADKTFTSLEFGYADHGFFCEQRKAYNETAAKHSFALLQSFLHTHLD